MNTNTIIPCTATRKKAISLLGKISDTPFYSRLCDELHERIDSEAALNQAEDVVDLILEKDQPDDIQEIFYAIRISMKDISKEARTVDTKLDAAAALYYMAFRQLVRRNEFAMPVDDYLLRIQKFNPNDYPDFQEVGRTIGAIVAAAVFGGVLGFAGSGKHRKPEHVHAMLIPNDADGSPNLIDRAMFRALFPSNERATGIFDGSIELTTGDIGNIQFEINDKRKGAKRSIAFWVENGDMYVKALSNAGTVYSVPMVLEHSEAMADILGMNVAQLLPELQSFWSLDAQTRKQENSLTSAQGDSPMPTNPAPSTVNNTTYNFNNNGSVANAPGNHNTANAQHIQNGIDAAALAPLLTALQTAISGITEPNSANHYKGLFNNVTAEVNAPARDKSKIIGLLEKIKDVPDFVEGSKAIGTAAAAAIAYLATFLS